LSSAAETTLPKRRYNKLLKPYWNTALKDLHENMRTLRHYWVADGKQTNHPSFRRYKDSKREFRQRLRQAARLHEQEEFGVLNNYLSWNRRGFGKLLVQENPRSVVQVVNLYLEIEERKQTTPS